MTKDASPLLHQIQQLQFQVECLESEKRKLFLEKCELELDLASEQKTLATFERILRGDLELSSKIINAIRSGWTIEQAVRVYTR